MVRAVATLVLLTLSGCTSMPHDSAQWRGHAFGRIAAQVASSSATLPTQGWLIESQRDQAAGFVSYTKWGSAGFRYKKQAYFQVREKWEPNVVYLGRFETRDGSSELCVVNPEHGGFQEAIPLLSPTPTTIASGLLGSRPNNSFKPKPLRGSA